MSFIEATELKQSPAKRAELKSSKKSTAVVVLATAPAVTRILRMVKTTSKGKIVVSYIKRVTWPLKDGEDKNRVDDVLITGKAPFHQHKDFSAALYRLTKHALELLEIYPDKEHGGKKDYTVTGIHVKGDIDMQTARVNLIVGKFVKRTDKIVPIVTGEVALYDNDGDGSDYADIDALAKDIETLQAEAFAYLDGKAAEEEIKLVANNQLPLF
jgi:hypothetical protein